MLSDGNNDRQVQPFCSIFPRPHSRTSRGTRIPCTPPSQTPINIQKRIDPHNKTKHYPSPKSSLPPTHPSHNQPPSAPHLPPTPPSQTLTLRTHSQHHRQLLANQRAAYRRRPLISPVPFIRDGSPYVVGECCNTRNIRVSMLCICRERETESRIETKAMDGVRAACMHVIPACLPDARGLCSEARISYP